MRLATWNVNGLRARRELVVHWLLERRPDVVGLQELKLTDEQFPRAEFEQIGYRSLVHGQKAWNGVAILSREPATETRRGIPGQEDLGARLLTADVGGISFTTVYTPNGKSVGHEDFPRKLAWLDALVEHVGHESDPDRPAVICGDLNVAPAPIDSWNEQAFRGAIFHTDDERARIRRLIESGFRDVFRDKFPDTPAFSWWDYRGGAFHRGQGLRIDLLLANRSLAARVRSIEIDRDWRKKQHGLVPSDHAPVFADLE